MRDQSPQPAIWPRSSPVFGNLEEVSLSNDGLKAKLTYGVKMADGGDGKESKMAKFAATSLEDKKLAKGTPDLSKDAAVARDTTKARDKALRLVTGGVDYCPVNRSNIIGILLTYGRFVGVGNVTESAGRSLHSVLELSFQPQSCEWNAPCFGNVPQGVALLIGSVNCIDHDAQSGIQHAGGLRAEQRIDMVRFLSRVGRRWQPFGQGNALV